MRRATKYDCIMFDREPFLKDNKKYDYLNSSNINDFAEVLRKDDY